MRNILPNYKLENEIANKCDSNKCVCLAGDTNCRVGSMRDFVISDSHLNETFNIDLLQVAPDKYSILKNLSINLERKSQDRKLNTNGCKLLDICAFLKPYYCRRPSTFKFIQIMILKKSEEISKLSKNIFKAFKERIP